MAISTQMFTVAWIAALSHERAAGEAMFDDEFEDGPDDFKKSSGDVNAYSWGRIGKHYVLIASLPAGEYGISAAATIAQALRSSLPHIRVGLLVGIGAGIPGEILGPGGTLTPRRDVRLGDVVVSEPSGTSGGVVQLDMVKMLESKAQPRPLRIGNLNSPPIVLRTALSKLKARHERKASSMLSLMEQALGLNPKMATAYVHPRLKKPALAQDIYHFRDGTLLAHDARTEPIIHYGVIGSSNTLVKSAVHRDQLMDRLAAEDIDPLCIEMEAAGLMNSFPCLVIRGVCDYADKYKNNEWQRYASLVAASFAKEYLSYIQPDDVERTAPLSGDSGMRR
jgi:nucleoside phosphorylase